MSKRKHDPPRTGFHYGGLFFNWKFVFAAALLVRLAYLYESSDSPFFEVPIVDSMVYSEAAAGLANGEGFSGSFFFQPFLYQFFLAVLYIAGDGSILFAKAIQALLGSITCCLAFSLGKRMFGRGAAVAAGLICAFYGPLIFFETELLATGLAAFMMVLLVTLFIKASEDEAGITRFLLGVAGAAAVLTRPTFLLLFIVGLVWLAAMSLRRQQRTGRGRMRRLAVPGMLIALGFLLPTLPVACLNRSITGHFGFLPSSGGLNIFIGNNEAYEDTVSARPGSAWSDVIDLPKKHGVRGDMWDRQRFYYEKTAGYIASTPLSFASGLCTKSLQAVSSRETARNVDIYLFRRWSVLLRVLLWKLGPFGFPFGLLLPLAVVGLFFRAGKTRFVVVLSALAYSISIVAVFVTARYRVPLVPLLAVFAGAGAAGLMETIRLSRIRKLVPALAAAAAMLLLGTLPGPFAAEKTDLEPELQCCLAQALQRMRRIDEAEACYKKAIEMNAEYADAHVSLATIYIMQGRIREARQHCEKAIEAAPGLAHARMCLGVVLRSEGRLEQAIEQYKKGLEIRPHEEAFYFNLAMIRGEMGEFGRMKDCLNKALELNPNHEPSRRELARLLDRK